jgi:hypothetical protein
MIDNQADDLARIQIDLTFKTPVVKQHARKIEHVPGMSDIVRSQAILGGSQHLDAPART